MSQDSVQDGPVPLGGHPKQARALTPQETSDKHHNDADTCAVVVSEICAAMADAQKKLPDNCVIAAGVRSTIATFDAVLRACLTSQ